MTRYMIALVLLLAAVRSVAAANVTVFVYAEPDPSLGGLTSAGLLDSVEDLRVTLKSMVIRGLKITDKREDANLFVQFVNRGVVNEEYRVSVQVTFPDGTKRDMVGTDTRRWRTCMEPIAEAIKAAVSAQRKHGSAPSTR